MIAQIVSRLVLVCGIIACLFVNCNSVSAQIGYFDYLNIGGTGNVIDFSPAGIYSFSVFANPDTFDIDGFEESAFSIERFTRSDTLRLGESGVGIGVIPEHPLDIYASSDTTFRDARIVLENFFPDDVETSTMLRMINSGPVRFEMENTDSGRIWSFVADTNNQFQIRQNGSGTASFAIRDNGTFAFNYAGRTQMILQANGNLRINGNLVELSDREAKTNLVAVDCQQTLAKVIQLPLSQWSYKKDKDQIRHLGPMAQDFHKAFGLGEDEKGICTLDTSGVALAAIQGLHEQVQEKNARIKMLEQKLADHAESTSDRIARLESIVESLMEK